MIRNKRKAIHKNYITTAPVRKDSHDNKKCWEKYMKKKTQALYFVKLFFVKEQQLRFS